MSPDALAAVECSHKIVVSSQPVEGYEGVIVVSSPEDAVDYLQDKIDVGLLVGGSRLNASFANSGLIDEIAITEKPVELEIGTPFFDSTLVSELDLDELRQEKLTGGRVRVYYSAK